MNWKLIILLAYAAVGYNLAYFSTRGEKEPARSVGVFLLWPLCLPYWLLDLFLKLWNRAYDASNSLSRKSRQSDSGGHSYDEYANE